MSIKFVDLSWFYFFYILNSLFILNKTRFTINITNPKSENSFPHYKLLKKFLKLFRNKLLLKTDT